MMRIEVIHHHQLFCLWIDFIADLLQKACKIDLRAPLGHLGHHFSC
jgi:hypothetical protein